MAAESEGVRGISRFMSDLLIGKISRKKSGGQNRHRKKKKPLELQEFQGVGAVCSGIVEERAVRSIASVPPSHSGSEFGRDYGQLRSHE